MTAPIFNSFYPWCKDKEPPVVHSPFPQNFDHTQGKGWLWGMVRPPRLEHYSKKSLDMNEIMSGINNTDSYKRIEQEIQWSEDEYIHYQWAPTDLTKTWMDNERKFLIDVDRREKQKAVNHWDK